MLSCDLRRYKSNNNLKDMSDRFNESICKYFDADEIFGLEETAALLLWL